MCEWLSDHKSLVLAGSILSLAASAIVVPILVTRMPADYFVRTRPRADPVLHALKVMSGFLLILVGIVMLIGPGQGILTLLMGLTLAEGPGKRAAEVWMIRRKPVHRAIDWIRRRAGRPPLELP